MLIGEDDKISIKHLTLNESQFILDAFNESSFIENVGDKNIRSIREAEEYLLEGPIASYQNNGFGMNVIFLKSSNKPIGLCGLVKRETFEHPDIGYALLPEFWGQGIARSASKIVLEYASSDLGLKKILAFTSPHNEKSAKLLEKLGFGFVKQIALYREKDYLYEINL